MKIISMIIISVVFTLLCFYSSLLCFGEEGPSSTIREEDCKGANGPTGPKGNITYA